MSERAESLLRQAAAGDKVARDPVAAMQALAAQRKQAGATDE